MKILDSILVTGFTILALVFYLNMHICEKVLNLL